MRFSHVMLYVADVARAAEWYRRVLGFEPTYIAAGEFASLRERNGARLDLHRASPSAAPSLQRGHTAVTYFTSSQFDIELDALRAAGVNVDQVQGGPGPRHVIFRDCDGNPLGLEEAS